MPENRFKQLRENTKTDATPALTQVQLSDAFADEGTPLSQSVISKLELSKKEPPTTSFDVLKAYSNHFNTTSDYLLGFTNEPSRNIDRIISSNITGLSGKAIDCLESIKNDPSTKYLLQILNVLMEDKDSFTALLANIDFFMNPHTYSPGVATNNPVHGKRVVNPLHAGDCNAFIKLNSSKECMGTYEVDQNFMASACMIKIFEILLDYKLPTKKEQV